MEYTTSIPYKEFREYLVEGDRGGWGDDFFHKTFDEFVVDDMIEIEYKYEHDPHVCRMKWRIPDTKKVYRVRYSGSSPFALWWSNYMSE